MARAKNTSRAEARRRARAEARADLDATRQLADEEEQPTTTADATDAAPAPRPSAFRLPNFGQDIRDLPAILTSRRLMAVPPLILVIGFLLQLGIDAGAIPTRHGLPMPLAANGWISFADVALLYIQMLFLPPSLLT